MQEVVSLPRLNKMQIKTGAELEIDIYRVRRRDQDVETETETETEAEKNIDTCRVRAIENVPFLPCTWTALGTRLFALPILGRLLLNRVLFQSSTGVLIDVQRSYHHNASVVLHRNTENSVRTHLFTWSGMWRIILLSYVRVRDRDRDGDRDRDSHRERNRVKDRDRNRDKDRDRDTNRNRDSGGGRDT